MSPTLQNTRAQRNAALARSSSSTGRIVNVLGRIYAKDIWHGTAGECARGRDCGAAIRT